MLLEAIKQTALIILYVYLALGFITMIIAYIATNKRRSISLLEHLVNLSFIILWLPYFWLYNAKYKD